MLACGCAASTAWGQDQGETRRREFKASPLTATWRILVGGNLNAFETRAAWSATGLGATGIVLEEALGLDEQAETWIVQVIRRLGARHSLELTATDLRRSAVRTIQEDIEWGDYVFRADGRVAVELDTLMVKIKWRYDFSDSGRLNTGFSAGLSTFDIGMSLKGEARLEADTGEAWIEGVAEGANVLAPVPVVGFYLEYALSPRWMLRFNSEVTDLDLGSDSGRVLQTDFAVQYGFTDLLGFGLGLGGHDIEYRSKEDDEQFGVSYRIKFASAVLSFSF
jgi:hypothetical protein